MKMLKSHKKNARVLQGELKWFQEVLDARIQSYFNQEKSTRDPMEIPAPKLEESRSSYVKAINRFKFKRDERLVILLALIPQLQPQLLDILYTKNKLNDRGYTEFGGTTGQNHGGILPTLETALFLLAGDDIARRIDCQALFDPEHTFRGFHLLELDERPNSGPHTATPLCLSREFSDLLILGRGRGPEWRPEFPAKLLQTKMGWNDLVLVPQTLEQLSELRAWLDHGQELLNHWNMESRIKPGYRCLFYGQPGTGKTLTASLMGKVSKRDVYRIDLSQLISKYIGETEKNLERVFWQAERNDWILFFDEADSLFGKRTQISDSHDRYANQGTSYLLQRLEDCPNVVILASNLKENLDEAFTRRFQSIIYFPMPTKKERLKLWQQGFSSVARLEDRIDLEDIAEKYEMAGGAIINVIRYASLMAIQKSTYTISATDLLNGIRREFAKEGKTA